MKDAIRKQVIDIVCSTYAITAEELLSDSRKEIIVDARHLAVALMADCGLYPNIIAELLGCSYRNICIVLSHFSGRCKRRKLLRYNYEKLKQQITNTTVV